MLIGYTTEPSSPLLPNIEARINHQISIIQYRNIVVSNQRLGTSYNMIQYLKEYPIDKFPPISPGQDSFE
jgi:hypothetical protein